MSSAQCLIFSRRKPPEVVYSSSDTCLLCPGKVPGIRGKLVHFPGVLIDREACMSVVLECSRGKVPGIRGKLVHFPGGFQVVPLCEPPVVYGP